MRRQIDEPDKQTGCSHLYHLGRTLARAKAEAASLGLPWEDFPSWCGIAGSTARRAIDFYARAVSLGVFEKAALMKLSITEAMVRLRIINPTDRSHIDLRR